MIASILHALRTRAKVGAVVHVMGIRIVALAGNVGSGLLTAAFLGPVGRGEQTAVGVAPLVLGSLCGLGLHASLIYNLRQDDANAPRYFGSAIILTSLVSIAAMILGFLLLPFWLRHYSAGIIGYARLFLLVIPFSVVTPLFMGVLEANAHFGVANRVLYFQSIGNLVLLGLLVMFGWLTPASAAACYILPSLPCFFYLLRHATRMFRPRLTLSAPFPRRLLRFGLKFYGFDILGVLAGYLDQAVIVFLLQPSAVGAYAVALSMSRVLSVAQGAVSTVLFPSIAGREPARVVEMVAQATRITTVLNAAAALGIGLVGPSLLLLLYGSRFAAAIMPFLVLLAEAVVSSAARTLAQAFSGTGRPSMVTGVEAAGVFASLAAMVIFVPRYGITGAACGSLFGGGVRLLCVLAGFRPVLGIDLPRLMISRADVAWVAGR